MSNVIHFGAAADGLTDDTKAIQHAINDGDGLVELPRGIYRITKPLVIELKECDRTAVVGFGGTAKILMDGEGPAFIVKATHGSTADPTGFRDEEWLRERMPMFSDFEIEGVHPKSQGILIDGVMQPTLKGVLIRKVHHAVHVVNRARNLLIDHCHFYHNRGVGVFLDNVNLHQTIISSSHISYCRLGGIRIENSEIRNLQITGNDIEYNNVKVYRDLSDEPTAEIYVDVGEKGTVREGTISSNTIQSTYSEHGANIRFIGGAGDDNHRAGMWTITGNLIGSQKNNIHLTSIRGVTISGNYIYSGHHRNILIERSRNVVIGPNCMGHNPDYKKNELATGIRLEDSTNCNLSGLLIEDAEAGKHTVPGVVPIAREALVEILRCSRVNINGCQVLDPTPNGIFVVDSNEVQMNGCTILDDRTPPKMENAIFWVGEGKGNAILNCRIGSGTQGTIKASESIHQSGNLVD